MIQSHIWEEMLSGYDNVRKKNLEEMATHSSILAWKIQWTEEPGGLQFIGVAYNWMWLSTQQADISNPTEKMWDFLLSKIFRLDIYIKMWNYLLLKLDDVILLGTALKDNNIHNIILFTKLVAKFLYLLRKLWNFMHCIFNSL